MNRLMMAVAFLAGMVLGIGHGASTGKDTVMGNWEGMWYDDAMFEGDLSAKIVDEGNGNYRALVEAVVGQPQPAKGVLQGKQKGEAVEFKGTIDLGPNLGGVHECWAKAAAQKLVGRYDGPEYRGRFEMKKVAEKPPTLGAKPPEGAIVLFDGKDLSKWTLKGGGANPWKIVDGAMEIAPGKGDIVTRDTFGDFKLHLEFRVPLMEEARGQGRGNSGVFLPGNCEEVQILDSFGFEPDKGSCGAIYDQKPPDVNASLPPGEWQTYDITCLVPRFDENGSMIQKTILTVYHNGVLIHDRFPAKRQTARRHGDDFRRILLQDHGNPAQFRNIWLVPLKSE